MAVDPEIQARFVRELTRLNVWYVHHLTSSGKVASEMIPQLLARQVNIYRLTVFWDGIERHDPAFGFRDQRWDQLRDKLASLIEDSVLNNRPAPEEEALALLWPLMDARLGPELEKLSRAAK